MGDARVAAVRRFNRFYTLRIGVLQESYLHSPFSVSEGRVLYELAHRRNATASEIGAGLGLDPGYLSRIVRSLTKRRLLRRRRADDDARKTLLTLTARGESAFARLNDASERDIAAMLQSLSEPAQKRFVQAIESIERVFDIPDERPPSYLLRTHQPGDLGWIVERHGALYAQEYGWNEQFEALVAEIAAKFLRGHDPKRERCWIAERDGERVGSVLLVKRSKRVAQLRLLLVEPSARSLGLGTRLVDECIRFARQARYARMILWTNDVLHAARRIYERAGFRLTKEGPYRGFGSPTVAQTWELKL